MIIGNQNAALSTNIDGSNGTNFRINASAHAFEILSSGIYEHKIAAVVRELCTNAFDSHVQAGKGDVPFSVVLPNELHPYFEVEDFGIGMSVQDAMDVYTVYFCSTKNSSNEVAGGLGIGGKSPFAYTRQFNIRIRKDGEENLAIIYVDANGQPRLDIIHTCQTTEQNGVKVSVPVEAKDFRTFIGEAKYFLSFYPVKPKFNLNVEVNFDNVYDKLEEDGYAFVSRNSYVESALAGGNFYAVMSPVPYMVNINSIVEDRIAAGLLKTAADKSGCLFVKFDIGELSVSASRESLSLDEKTILKLREKFTAVAEKIGNSIKAMADDATKHPVELYKNFVEEFGGDFYLGFVPEESHLKKVFRNIKVPRLGQHNIRAGWRRSGHFFAPRWWNMRDMNMTSFNTNGVVKIIVIDCGKKLIRDLFSSQNCSLVYRDEVKGLTELRKSRLEKIFNIKIETVNYSDLYKKHLADKKAARGTTPKVPRVKHPETSIVASGVIVEKSSSVPTRLFGNEVRSLRVNIDENTYKIHSASRYELETDTGHIVDRTKLEDVAKTLCEYFKMDSLKVFCVSAQNKTRMESNKVPCISELIQKFVEENKTQFETFVKAGAAKDRFERLRWDYATRDAMDLIMLESKHVPKEVYDAIWYIKELSENDGSRIPDDLHRFFPSDDSLKFKSEVHEQYNKIVSFSNEAEKLKKLHYPVVENCHFFHHHEDRKTKRLEHAKMYVNMIDSLPEDATIEYQEEVLVNV